MSFHTRVSSGDLCVDCGISNASDGDGKFRERFVDRPSIFVCESLCEDGLCPGSG